MAFRKLFATFSDKHLEQVWHDLNRRIADAIDGIVVAFGGDLREPSPGQQEVVALRGIPTPDPTTAQSGRQIVVGVPGLKTPRSLQSDGTYLYVGQSGQCVDNPGSPLVLKLEPDAEGNLALRGTADLSAQLPSVDRVRDLAQDATYLYCACWNASNIAIVDKASMAIVGWAYAGPNTRVTSVCTDGAGNLFCYVEDQGYAWASVFRFSVAACVGQPPNTATADAIYLALGRARWVDYGAGAVWLTDGGNSGFGIDKIDPVAMVSLGTALAGQWAMGALEAFGSVWVLGVANRSLFRLDPATLATQATVPLSVNGSEPVGIAVGPDTTGAPAWLYVTLQDSYVVHLVNPATNTEVTTASPDEDMTYDGVATIGSRVYVGGFCSNVSSVVGIGWVTATGATSVATSNLSYAGPYVGLTPEGLLVVKGETTAASLRGTSAGQVPLWNGSKWSPGIIPSVDQLVKVTGNDTTPGYLYGKLVAGANIGLTITNPGGDESLLVDNLLVGFTSALPAGDTGLGVQAGTARAANNRVEGVSIGYGAARLGAANYIVAAGFYAMGNVLDGYEFASTAVGYGALQDGSTVFGYNTAIGHAAGSNQFVSDQSGTFVGAYAQTYGNAWYGPGNTAIGANSWASGKTPAFGDGQYNTACGYDARAEGNHNISIGAHAGNHSGLFGGAQYDQDVICIGWYSGDMIVGASRVVAIGTEALRRTAYSTFTCYDTVAIGHRAAAAGGVGPAPSYAMPAMSVFVGSQSGENATECISSVFVGYRSGRSGTQCSANTFVGAESGLSVTTGRWNCMFGFQADLTLGTLNNCVAMGYLAKTSRSGAVQIGSGTNNIVPVGATYGASIGDAGTYGTYQCFSAAWSVYSDRALKDGIRSISAEDAWKLIGRLNPVEFYYKSDEQKTPSLGLIAQEVAKAVDDERHCLWAAGDEGNWSVNYTQLIAPLIRAAQDLRAEVNALKSELRAAREEIAALKG